MSAFGEDIQLADVVFATSVLSTPLSIDDPLPCVMIRSWQQRTLRFLVSLFDGWLPHLETGSLETPATVQPSYKGSNTVVQAKLFATPPMTRGVQDDTMFALPASDAEVAFVECAFKQRTDRPIVLFSGYPSVRRLPAHFIARGTS